MKKWIVGLMTFCLLCLFSGCTGPQTETAREKESRKVTIENTDTQGTPEVESDKDSASDTSAPYPGDPSGSETEKEEEKTEMGLHLKLGTHDVPVEWEDTESVRALAELAAGGLSVSMSRYGGFEHGCRCVTSAILFCNIHDLHHSFYIKGAISFMTLPISL